MFHGVAIARVVIATRFLNGCNSMFLFPRFSGVVIIFVALQLLSTYCNYNPKWSQYHVNIARVFLCCYRLPLMQRPKSVAIYKIGCNIQNVPRIRLPLMQQPKSVAIYQKWLQ